MATPGNAPPTPGAEAGRRALRALLGPGGILASLEAIHAEMGDVFQIRLPGFTPLFLVGPQANHFVAVSGRNDLRWRSEGDPVTTLLREGLLVTDGEQHDALRRQMLPPLHKRKLAGYLDIFWERAGQVSAPWGKMAQVDMLVEMRRLALLVLMDSLYCVDVGPDLPTLWPHLMRTLSYISPGLWMLLPGAPRPGYQRALAEMDRYLYELITARRRTLRGNTAPAEDLLGLLLQSGFSDGQVRDQLLTILIAGHDTSTALLAWALYLLGSHPQAMAQATAEVVQVLGRPGGPPPTIEQLNQLGYLDRVISETLRLYPPIHIGNRRAAVDLEFAGYRIPAGTRVVYSIYLTHRMERYWPDSHRFDPQRFLPENARQRPPYTYIPFGGGPRNCIGLAFAQVEVKAVLARLLQDFELTLVEPQVHAHMGATLEPRPGVRMCVRRWESLL